MRDGRRTGGEAENPALQGARYGESASEALLRYVVGNVEALGAALRRDDVEEEARRLGWMLAVLASGAELDLLRDRRESDGLTWAVECARDALQASGVSTRLEGQRPLSIGGPAQHWRAPQAVACSVWTVGRRVPRSRVAWSAVGTDVELRIAGDSVLDEPTRQTLSQCWSVCPDARVDFDAGECSVLLPGDWIALESC